ncbi:MAG: hypothetical protein JW825_02375 [Candidatus Methanofastidiosa archaeon]|nr:hypothetical protein [Candidatus Methanofastidiosa archaeon]
MAYQWTYYSLLALASSVLSMVLFVILYRKRRVPGSRVFMVLLLALSQWSLCEFLHILYTGLGGILFWSKLSYIGIVMVPATWFIFSLYYSGRDKYVNTNNVLLLSVVPFITLVLVLTNGSHSLIWDNITLSQLGSIVYYVKDYGIWFYVNMIYSYILLSVSIYYIVDPFSTSFSLYKKQRTFLLIALLIPWVANILYLTIGPALYSIDITPLSFLMTSIVMLYSTFNLGFLDIVPIAQKNILENIMDIIIVLDNSNRVAYINEKAREFLTGEDGDIVGKELSGLMPGWTSTLEYLSGDINGREGIITEREGEKYYSCAISNLHQRQCVLGTLLIIRDVTSSIKYELRINKLNEHLSLINKILRHDISNNLTIASFSIEMMRAENMEMKKRAMRSISRSIELINRMKDLEMVISQGDQLKRYKVSEVVAEIIKNYPSVKFNVKGDCTILADDAISSVFDNIISNAVMHGRAERIDVEMGVEEDLGIIKIMDNGIGIPDDVKMNIFKDEFSYGENKGTGIGLYIVKKVVERYGGDISVSDNSPKGSIFTLILRMAPKSL